MDGHQQGLKDGRADALHEAGQLVRDHLFGKVDAKQVSNFLSKRATRVSDSKGKEK